MRNLRREYLDLLDADKLEAAYQTFIEKHTSLVPREFELNHGIWASMVFRQLPLGSSYKPDFAFITKSTVQWRCVFVEIERPGFKFFGTSKETPFDPHFNQALQQIGRWRAWFEEDGLAKATQVFGPMLTFPQARDPVDVRFVLVYGRAAELESNPQRRSWVRAEQREDLRIMSFDGLVEGLESKEELYLGAMHNEYVEVLSDTFLSWTLFQHMEPECIRVNESLFASAERAMSRNSGGESLLARWQAKHVQSGLERLKQFRPRRSRRG
ncbi:MAG: DUF4263 domain-containing protein [Rhodospirillaceae bacterium]|nr:DUF4263 domain-containing protein [Rhodospirillaceae bacterium]